MVYINEKLILPGKGGSNIERSDEIIANKIYIGNIDKRIPESKIIEIAERFGKVIRVNYIWHSSGPQKGQPAGISFVEFSKRSEAEAAVAGLNGKKAFGKPLKVRFANQQGQEISEAETLTGSKLSDRPPLTDQSILDEEGDALEDRAEPEPYRPPPPDHEDLQDKRSAATSHIPLQTQILLLETRIQQLETEALQKAITTEEAYLRLGIRVSHQSENKFEKEYEATRASASRTASAVDRLSRLLHPDMPEMHLPSDLSSSSSSSSYPPTTESDRLLLQRLGRRSDRAESEGNEHTPPRPKRSDRSPSPSSSSSSSSPHRYRRRQRSPSSSSSSSSSPSHARAYHRHHRSSSPSSSTSSSSSTLHRSSHRKHQSSSRHHSSSSSKHHTSSSSHSHKH